MVRSCCGSSQLVQLLHSWKRGGFQFLSRLAGMKLSDRYTVCSQLGEGTFGRVVECQEVNSGKLVAIKVVRDIARYTSAAQIEAEILEEIREKDSEGQSNCVVLLERFLYDRRRGRQCRSSSLRERCSAGRLGERRSDSTKGSAEDSYGAGIHMCLVSEKLGLSLFAFLSKNRYRGLFMEDIQKVCFEVLKALAFLRKIKLTHTDLKVS